MKRWKEQRSNRRWNSDTDRGSVLSLLTDGQAGRTSK